MSQENPTENSVIASWMHMRRNMPLEPMRLARHAFEAIVGGNPTTVTGASIALGMSIEEVESHVETVKKWGLMTTEGDTITGSLGITIEPTKYGVEIEGKPLHVWCALDAVGIPAALETDARVKVEGLADISIKKGQLEQVNSESLRISLADPYIGEDMRQQICPTISFHQQEGKPHEKLAWLRIDEAMNLGRVIWEAPSPENTRSGAA